MNLDSAAKMTRGRHRKQDFGSEIRVGDETRVLSLLENGKMNIFQGVSYRPAKFQGFPNAVSSQFFLWRNFFHAPEKPHSSILFRLSAQSNTVLDRIYAVESVDLATQTISESCDIRLLLDQHCSNLYGRLPLLASWGAPCARC